MACNLSHSVIWALLFAVVGHFSFMTVLSGALSNTTTERGFRFGVSCSRFKLVSIHFCVLVSFAGISLNYIFGIWNKAFFRARVHNYVTIPLADWHIQAHVIRFLTFCGMMTAMDIYLININYVSSSFSVPKH